MNIKIVDELMVIENQLTELLSSQKNFQKVLYKIKNELITAFQNADGTWTRMSVTDNVAKLDEGFFKTVRVERYSLKIETLKNMPKELKEVKQ